MKFKFEPGHYALAGREKLLDRDVLRVEYYPTRLFEDKNDQRQTDRGDDRRSRRQRREDAKEQAVEERIDRQMNKVSFITLWIEPTAHQILQYQFTNIDPDFLPGRSMVRIDDMMASMRMAQPFPDVWLPDAIAMRFRMTLAVGDVSGFYDVRYH